MNKKILLSILSFTLAFMVALGYWWLVTPRSLTFSDSARYADAARSITETGESVIYHSYYSSGNLPTEKFINGWRFNSSPVTVKILSYVFRWLPVNDLTITLTGIIAFSLSAVLVFLISTNIHSTIAGFTSLVLFCLNPFFLEYAVNNSSEMYLVLEALLAVYLVFGSEKLKILVFAPIILMLYTRPQATVFLVGLVLFYLLVHLYQKSKNRIGLSVVLTLIGLVLLLTFLTISYVLINSRKTINLPHLGSVFIPTTTNPGQFLRGVSLLQATPSLLNLVGKLFYNTYNFFKDIPRILNPAVFWLFIIGIFAPISKEVTRFNVLTTLLFTLFILAASVTLPNARYVHPVTPLVIISAGIFLVDLLNRIKVKHQLIIISVLLVLATLPVWGDIFIDHRFRSRKFNLSKPPVYQKISKEIATHTQPDKLILTNLDAWGSWYSRITTMWFPLSPDMLKKVSNTQDLPQYIAITSYKEHDGDFALGEWKEVVYSPENLQNDFLTHHYLLLKTFDIQPDQIYENQAFKGTILIKK